MNRQIWWQRAAVVLPLIVYASAAFAQKPACEHGVLQLPAQVNAPFEICSALAAQVPGLSQQLAKVAQTLSTQHDQIEKLNRLIGSMNSVSQNLGPERQVQMLNNFASILMASQKGGQEQTERKISALAEGFEQLKDQLVTLLTNRATADKANAAIDGSTGDDIARLDLASAHSELEEIRAQLKAIGSEVGEVNQRVQDIQNSLNLQSMDVGRVSNDLASANVEALNRLTASGVPTNVLEEAFRRKTADGKASVARRFFESSADSPQAMKWFDAAISKGLDPNMTVPGDYYSSEALLIEAMRASNVAAMKVLLARGVNPHPYQDLALTRFEGVRFLFPLHFIADDDHLSLEDKQSLTKAFLDAGVVIPKVLPPNGNAGWQSVMYEVNQLQEQATPNWA